MGRSDESVVIMATAVNEVGELMTSKGLKQQPLLTLF